MGTLGYGSNVEPSRDAILAALETVIDPELQRPVTELDMVRGIEVEDGIVSLTIVLTIAGCPLRDSFERQVETALKDVPGVRGFALSFGVMTPEERSRFDRNAEVYRQLARQFRTGLRSTV